LSAGVPRCLHDHCRLTRKILRHSLQTFS
jgi:hypothetical protein